MINSCFLTGAILPCQRAKSLAASQTPPQRNPAKTLNTHLKSITNSFLSSSASKIFWILIWGFPYIVWIYSILVKLNEGIPKAKRIKKIFFLPLVAYPPLYLVAAPFIFKFGSSAMDSIRLFHYAAMACMFLLMILTTITILKFEKSQNMKESNGVDLFIGLWFFPFGIWTIQPKLNKYYQRIA